MSQMEYSKDTESPNKHFCSESILSEPHIDVFIE